jgi:hypothetical protein
VEPRDGNIVIVGASHAGAVAAFEGNGAVGRVRTMVVP